MKTWILAVLVIFMWLRSPAWTAPAYPLRVADDGRHIIDQQDNPVYFHAESAWHVITRLTREAVVQYLNNRQAKGFNAIVVMLLVAEGYHGASNNLYGDPPFLQPGDFDTPNEAYFAHADWVLQQADARGLTVFLAPAYLGYQCRTPPDNQGWCTDMKQSGAAKMHEWGRWVGNRYRDQPNIVWLNGGDADASAHWAVDVVDAVAEGIREVDSNHLHTAHCDRYHSAADCYDRPWLDFNATYAQCQRTPQLLRTDYRRLPLQPFVFIEGRYEVEQDWTDVCIRSQAYWSMLGGASGHVFGSGRIWGYFDGWQTAMESQGSRSMEHFATLLRSRRWDLLIPDYSHIVLTRGHGDVGSPLYAPAARTSDGNTVIVYTPTKRKLTIDLGQIAGDTAIGWWYDPATGVSQSIGSFPSSGARDFIPPFDQDWVLVLDNESVPVQTKTWDGQ